VTATAFAPVSLARVALLCRCPRCGEGRIFRGLLSVRETCPACALDLSAEDAGDGPAVFLILLLGAVAVGLAAWLEIEFEPPIWVHLAILAPIVIGGAIGLLRPMKAMMIALQYRHNLLDPPPG
jgi:uncharacterized protein (DUF983 family)